MGIIIDYFKKKQDGKTSATAYNIDDVGPFSLEDEPVLEETMAVDKRSSQVVRTYSEK